ncbi:proteinral negative regulator of transcription subunit 5 [Haplosporangium sp. Z 767]|nr:proteinral negative regulator of transcription subunit 5 [Haplosporangium sp. Z 767]KAF9184858.1 proteinral negative regulator of transcription subunit 5 [Haplosporangium sp. Z 11]
MATRKLQTEIDKVLKKVGEGVETFEETLEKIETTTNANQKEKYESDLKKEIKKLQRLRDQIKTWISSSDIKDKTALMDNRKLIEQQMEKFKAIEKEMKTKAYSREGLIMSGRMDPKEKEKAETCSWVAERVEALNIQIEALEAKVETLQAGAKKGRNNPARERISELEEKIERHKWHQGRLELILRLLENGQIETERASSIFRKCWRLVIGIQEDVNYYVDENLDPDFAEDEEIYTDLNLEEEEDYYAIGADDHHASQDQDDKQKDDQQDAPSKKQAKEPEPAPSPSKVTKPSSTKKPSFSEPKETKPVPTTSPTAAKSVPITTVPPSRQSTLSKPVSVEQPVIQYATAVAANLPTETARTVPSTASPKATAAVVIKNSPRPTDATTKTEATSPQPATKPAPAETSTASTSSPIAPQEQVKPSPTKPTAAVKVENASPKATATATTAPSSTESMPSTTQAGLNQSSSQALEENSQPRDKAPEQPAVTQPPSVPAEPEIRLPAALADLAHSFEASKERAMSKESGFFVHQMLEASYQFMPEAADTERPKYYAPKNPYPAPSYYPQSPPPGLFDNAAMFEKFDLDTLFFIFYYQQGTYQQYLAARELKKQSWRFHKKYLTWFQRHEEPKAITDDYEQGTYIYFDYEGAWCQRKKTDFRFEYKYLEDSDLV